MVVGLALIGSYVSIRFKVRGDFRLADMPEWVGYTFQSALRFTVVSDSLLSV